MGPVLAALFPIIALIAMGHQIRSRQWLPDGFWAPAERATYIIFFPALLTASLAKVRLDGIPVRELLGSQGLAIVIMATLALSLAPLLRKPPLGLDGPGLTSVFQCVIRPNTYVGLAMSAGLWGSGGVALTAVCIALVVPLVNLLSVMVMLRWGEGAGEFRWRGAVLPILTNPLILACLLGLAINASGLVLPAPLASLLDILAGASLPLGLLAVGAGLQLRDLRATGPAVILAMAAKLVLLPLLVFLCGRAMGLEGLPLLAGVAYAALPASPSSYVLARQMGGDSALVATILSAQVLTSAITLPIWMALLG